MSQTVPEQTHTRLKDDWMQAIQSWLGHSQQIVLKWLYDVGGWIFAGLIAVALLLLQPLMTVSHIDPVLFIAGLTLAAALPLNLAGVWIVRYLKNQNQALADAALAPTRPSAGGDETTASNLPAFSAKQRQFTHLILSILFGLSVLLTLIGVVCALWHISGAVTLVFLFALVVGLLATLWVLAYRG